MLGKIYQKSEEFLKKDIKHFEAEDALLYCHAAIALVSLPIAVAIQKLVFDEQDANLVKEFDLFASAILSLSAATVVLIKSINLLIEVTREAIREINRMNK